jgi:hypothetical protein
MLVEVDLALDSTAVSTALPFPFTIIVAGGPISGSPSSSATRLGVETLLFNPTLFSCDGLVKCTGAVCGDPALEGKYGLFAMFEIETGGREDEIDLDARLPAWPWSLEEDEDLRLPPSDAETAIWVGDREAPARGDREEAIVSALISMGREGTWSCSKEFSRDMRGGKGVG